VYLKAVNVLTMFDQNQKSRCKLFVYSDLLALIVIPLENFNAHFCAHEFIYLLEIQLFTIYRKGIYAHRYAP
jgi:hypothetical protein